MKSTLTHKSNKLIFSVVTLFFQLLYSDYSISQNVGINNNGIPADHSAMLDIRSTNQGVLIPRMTDAQRQLLKDPAKGLLIYNLSLKEINYWNGTGWMGLPGSSVSTTSGSGIGPGGGVAINFNNNAADASAILDVSATDKGLLIPETTQGSITITGTGLIIYNTNTNQINFFDGSIWQAPCSQFIDNIKGTGATVSGESINISGAMADPSAILDVSSSNQGLLIPGMTSAERDAIKSPATGLIIYNTSDKNIENWIGTAWYALENNSLTAPTAGINTASANSITWSWNTVNGAAGYKWGTTTTYGSAIDNGTGTSYNQSGLACNTPYTAYVWAYNVCGNSNYVMLTQSTSSCNVQCGPQVWQAVNLNIGAQVNTSIEQTSPLQKWCYNNLPANCTTYGGEYEWATAVKVSYNFNTNFATAILGYSNENCNPCGPTTGHGGVQGICPSGYHIPSGMEWNQYEYCVENNISPKGTTSLITFQTTYGMRGSTVPGVGPGDKMKGGGTAMWGSGDTGTNASGFDGLPGGSSQFGSSFDIGNYDYIWSCSEIDKAFYATNRVLQSDVTQSIYYNMYKTLGMSVRCLQD